ncbi:hypothetical protein PsorP6_008654 [Peronosclerospora sorghi]|uniref:Uncharacterized protein n=1 Tax=Peronosclerospora sorghi TaxID=230839 RepID=A0ACC0WD66_9STRA|nr:hypothetical protein PsorP6_008654 [Peronosclerospora sorghi]
MNLAKKASKWKNNYEDPLLDTARLKHKQRPSKIPLALDRNLHAKWGTITNSFFRTNPLQDVAHFIECGCTHPNTETATAQLIDYFTRIVTAQHKAAHSRVLFHCSTECMLCMFTESVHFHEQHHFESFLGIAVYQMILCDLLEHFLNDKSIIVPHVRRIHLDMKVASNSCDINFRAAVRDLKRFVVETNLEGTVSV